jgi:hypothetical protein
MDLPEVVLIGAAVFLGGILFGIMAVWRNRKQRALRREMKRHLQRIGDSGYDPTNL